MTKQDLVNEKLKKLEEINRERPCAKCKWHRYKNAYLKCGLVTGACNFEHNRFEEVTETSTKPRSNSNNSQE